MTLSRFLTTCLFALTTATAESASPYPHRLLVVGDKDQSRSQQYVDFLEKEFRQVKIIELEDFKPSHSDDFDVVLVDWPQGGSIPRETSPLGPRDEWPMKNGFARSCSI